MAKGGTISPLISNIYLHYVLDERIKLNRHKLSMPVLVGTVCRKAARPGLWGSGEATNRSTRNLLTEDLKSIIG